MRNSIGAKPCIVPEPVLMIATYNEDGTPNVMNAAWGGIHEDDEVYICVGNNHKTTENLMKRKGFTLGFATERFVKECDYVGIVSGKNVPDKFAKAGFTATKSELVDAPIIDQLPICMECDIVSYENEELIGKIRNVSVDDSIITDGKVDYSKMRPIIYDPFNHDYLVVGDIVAKAFSVGKELK